MFPVQLRRVDADRCAAENGVGDFIDPVKNTFMAENLARALSSYYDNEKAKTRKRTHCGEDALPHKRTRLDGNSAR